jgi:hypothetical protein
MDADLLADLDELGGEEEFNNEEDASQQEEEDDDLMEDEEQQFLIQKKQQEAQQALLDSVKKADRVTHLLKVHGSKALREVLQVSLVFCIWATVDALY